MSRSYVVTGGGRGVGRAIVERLLSDEDAVVVVLERDPAALDWVESHSAGHRAIPLTGDAADPTVAERAADRALAVAPLAGWVNNAAVFQDAALHTAPAQQVLDLITMNLAPTLVGCATAVRRFLDAGAGGSIVNLSSHQAQRAVRGALPYATAKAAIEGLTRALAVDYGPAGIRVNAVALGSIWTERYQAFLQEQGVERAAHIEQQMALLHPLGRVGRGDEVADAVAYLLSRRPASSPAPSSPSTAAGPPRDLTPRRPELPRDEPEQSSPQYGNRPRSCAVRLSSGRPGAPILPWTPERQDSRCRCPRA